MTSTSTLPSGRPQPGEYADYAEPDIARVPGDNAILALQETRHRTLALCSSLQDSEVSGLTYAAGKWTFKQVLGHLADDERIYAYRALALARGELQPLVGFDENLYALNAGHERLPLAELLADYQAVRAASLTLLAGLGQEAWLRRGLVNGHSMTVRGLAFHMAGHELHHLEVLEQRYLSRLGA